MNINIREYTTEDAVAASEIWNQVVDGGRSQLQQFRPDEPDRPGCWV